MRLQPITVGFTAASGKYFLARQGNHRVRIAHDGCSIAADAGSVLLLVLESNTLVLPR